MNMIFIAFFAQLQIHKVGILFVKLRSLPIKEDLYNHFSQLLSTKDKTLLLDDNTFSAKFNPSQKYPPCNIDNTTILDVDGEVITEGVPSVPNTPDTSVTKTKTKAQAMYMSKSKKTRTFKARGLKTGLPKHTSIIDLASVEENTTALVEQTISESAHSEVHRSGSSAKQPIQPTENPLPRIPKKQKLDSSKLPSKCTLPSVLAYPTDKDDDKFVQMHFLPTSDLTGIDLFNAFVKHCNNSENHCVCVSRSFSV